LAVSDDRDFYGRAAEVDADGEWSVIHNGLSVSGE
jgi:hypothetical protein